MSAPPSDTTAARNILVRTHAIPLCDPAHPSDFAVEERLTEVENHERLAAKQRTRQAQEQQWRDQVTANGGSDRHADGPQFPHPGAEELAASLDSVKDGWRDIPKERLRFYVVSGVVPQDVSPEKLAAYRRTARAVLDDIDSDPQINAMLALMPPQMRTKFNAMRGKSKAANFEGLVALEWLKDAMRDLKVRKELADKVDFKFGRECALDDVWPAGRWAKAVAQHNGFCKTVLELQQHADADV